MFFSVLFLVTKKRDKRWACESVALGVLEEC